MAISAKNIGTNSAIKYHATAGTAASTVYSGGTAIGGVQSGSLTISTNMVDSTNNDDAGYTSAVYGNQSASFSLDCVFDPSDQAQSDILDDLTGKTKFRLGIGPIDGTGEDWYVFDALVESADFNPGENDGLQTISFSFVSDGTVTRTTIP